MKLNLKYINKYGVESIRELEISLSKLKQEETYYFDKNKRIYSQNFTLKIPPHIIEKLRGQTVSKSRLSDPNGTFTYDKKYSSVISSETIKGLTTEWETILNDFQWLLRIESISMVKTIFYSFNTKELNWSSRYDGKDFGTKSDFSFWYGIGYMGIDNKGGEYRYNFNKSLLSKNNDSEIYNLKSIEWTKEREEFFNQLQTSISGFLDRVRNFERSLTDKAIDQLIANNIRLLGE